MIVDQSLLTDGAKLFGADPASFTSLGGTDGAVYRCRIGNLAFVMKFVPVQPPQEQVFLERIAFIAYLAENGIPIASPIESPGGRRVERLCFADQTYLVTVMPLARGRHPQPRNLYDWNERLFQYWGQVMGRMHALTRAYPFWENPEGQSSAESFTKIEGWEEEFKFFADWCKETRVRSKWLELYPFLASLPRNRDIYGLVHNDLHQENFFYEPDARSTPKITIIDFDVCSYNWFISDIAVAVYHAAANGSRTSLASRRQSTRAFLASFMRGYEQENELDNKWLELLPFFMKYREILLYIAMTNSVSEKEQQGWMKRWLDEKHTRTLRDEPII